MTLFAFSFFLGCGDDKATNPPPSLMWQVVGTAGLSVGEVRGLSLFVANGTPYVAYVDAGLGDRVVVKKYDGTSWVQLGDTSLANDNDYVSLFVHDGTPYVAFDDGGPVVRKFENDTWMPPEGPISPAHADYISLSVEGGMPYVAFSDGGQDHKISVRKLVDSAWLTVGTEGFSDGMADLVSLFVDGGVPYVAFRDYAHTFYATVMKMEGGDWAVLGSPGMFPGEPGMESIFVAGGKPYVMFSRMGSGKANVMKYEDGAWHSVGSPDFTQGRARYGSLFIADGIPYLAFQDEPNPDQPNYHKATVMSLGGDGWKPVGEPGFTGGEVEYTSLHVSNGIPYVAFKDSSTDKVAVMKYAVKEQ